MFARIYRCTYGRRCSEESVHSSESTYRQQYHWMHAASNTVGCMRPDEGHNTQLCNWWPDYDARAEYAEFACGAALNISAQKSDAGRKGAHKRFGKAADPSLDFVDQMARFHAAAGLRVGESCTKRATQSSAA